MVLPYRKENIDGMLRRKKERKPKAEGSGPNFVRCGIIITMAEMVLAADAIVQRILARSLASVLTEHFKKRAIKISMALVREEVAECGENAPHVDVHQTIEKSRYMIEGISRR